MDIIVSEMDSCLRKVVGFALHLAIGGVCECGWGALLGSYLQDGVKVD